MATVDVISLTAAQQHLNMSEGADAEELAVHITAASELVEQLVGPVVIREFTDLERHGRRIALDHRPVVALVSVTRTNGSAALDVSGLRASSASGVIRRTDGGPLWGGPFDITYRAGRAATTDEVPAALALACRVIVAHMWETQRGASFGPQSDMDDAFSGPPGAAYAIPYRARDLMAPYRTVVVA